MKPITQIKDRALKLQKFAQTGLKESQDIFDIERYEKVSRIAKEILSFDKKTPKEQLKNIFLGNEDYQTPKLDTRAAIF